MTDRALLLDALLADPAKAAELTLDERHRLAAQLAAVQIALLAAPAPAPVQIATIVAEQWIDAHEAAALVHRSDRWIFSMSRREDWAKFTRRMSRKGLLVERRGLLDWIDRHTRQLRRARKGR